MWLMKTIMPGLLRRGAFACWLLALLGVTASPEILACTGQTACKLGERSYHVREPAEWDGKSALPVLIHFHGWSRQGTLVVRHSRIAVGAVARHALLVAPNGLNKTWAFYQRQSPDTRFAKAILEDLADRYPIDTDRIFVSGYSWGANMAWRFACDAGDEIAALLAVSGALSQTEPCKVAPAEVRQVFGLDDSVLRFPMGPDGDQTYPVALWRRLLNCAEGVAEGQWNARPFLTFERTSWDCEDGRVVLDVHPGGHFIPHDWIPLQVGELLDVERAKAE